MKQGVTKKGIDISRGEVRNNFSNIYQKKLPTGWKVKKLSDVMNLLGGNAFKSSDSSDKGIKWLKISNVGFGKVEWNTVDYLPNEFAKEYSKYLLKENDIVMALTRPILGGKLKIAKLDKHDVPALLNQRVAKLIPNEGYSLDFLYHLLSKRSTVADIENVIAGTDPPNLGFNDLKKVEIKVPPLPEQEKIAEILSTWDKAIELSEKLIEQKKLQKKGLMQKLLTGKVRLPGFEDEWEEVRLDKVVKKTKGKALVYVEGGKYPAIDMDYIETGKFKNYSNDATVIAKKNDVLLLWDGSRAGRAFTGIEGAVGSTFVKLECKSINNVFLQKHLEMNERKIQKLREGSGIPHMPKDFLHYYRINLPSKEEQEVIAYILENMDKSLKLLEKKVEQLKKQKKGLMQLLLTGKVRVKV